MAFYCDMPWILSSSSYFPPPIKEKQLMKAAQTAVISLPLRCRHPPDLRLARLEQRSGAEPAGCEGDN